MFLLESPQIRTFLVRIHRLKLIQLIWVAGNLRLGGAWGHFWASFNGRRPGSGGSGHLGDMDHCAGFADFLWEAQKSFGGGG